MPRNKPDVAGLDALRAAIADCQIRDRPGLLRLLGRYRDRSCRGQPADKLGARLRTGIAASQRAVAARRDAPMTLSFPDALPICQARDEIRDAIAAHPVVIVSGETGSGKTTQLPKICLEMGYGQYGMVGHTQPRRIAARSVARRIAAELGCEPGSAVGYQTRFDKTLGAQSRIKLMTDGILLSELRHDRMLRAYDVLILDEAHERSLNIDFLLGYLHRVLADRDDLKVIITSATIETEKISEHFDGAPVLEISGRTYPVDIEYLPAAPDDGADLAELVGDGVGQLLSSGQRRGAGDILVFLPGERQIVECRDLLRRRFGERLQVLPLFGRLSKGDQDRVFRPQGRTRCILATNIAETSITVPGIRYVVDSGLARISRYSVHQKVQQLPVEKISRASADQRAGRCGRLENGLCLRLYTEEDYLDRPAHTLPEIQRTNLARVILEMEVLGLGDVDSFPFVDPPDARFVRDGYRLLTELRAVDTRGNLLETGRAMARLPVDPRIARMILAAAELGCMAEMLVVAAALTIQDPRQRPTDSQQEADARHAEFADPRSDFVGFLRLWRAWQDKSRESRSAARRWCTTYFLSYPRMREWQDLVHQLHGLSADTRHPRDAGADASDALHQALLTGLIGHVGLREEHKRYRGTRGRRFLIFPGSALARKAPRWIMAALLLETSRLFAHVVAGIRPEWIEQAASHLVTSSYGDPCWDPARGIVVARETVSLYGLVVVAGRPVDFGRLDPGSARKVFISEALVPQDDSLSWPFLAHNRAVIESLRDIEARARRHDVLESEDVIAGFYDERIPEQVCDARSLARWLDEVPDADKRLRMSRDLLMRHPAGQVTREAFPDHLEVRGNTLELEYRFERGHEADGVTAEVPLALIGQIEAGDFDTLVPGMLEEKIQALLRGLPKKQRRQFVPVPDYARALTAALPEGPVPLCGWIAEKLRRMTGSDLQAADLEAVTLPPHLSMNFRLRDESGQYLGQGRDVNALKERFGSEARRLIRQALPEAKAQRGLVSWSFDELHEQVSVQRNGKRFVLYPALVDRGADVDLVFLDDPEAAREASPDGLARLAWLALPQQVRMIREAVSVRRRALLGWRRHGDEQELAWSVFCHLARAHFAGQDCDAIPRNHASFRAKLDGLRGKIVPQSETLLDLLERILDQETAIRRMLDSLDTGRFRTGVADAGVQLDGLLRPGFLQDTPPRWLARYPVWLDALAIRLEKLPRRPAADQAAMRSLSPLISSLQALRTRHPEWARREAVREFTMLLEELRVSLFAQQLGTIAKVSSKRLTRFWRERIAEPMATAGLGLPD